MLKPSTTIPPRRAKPDSCIIVAVAVVVLVVVLVLVVVGVSSSLPMFKLYFKKTFIDHRQNAEKLAIIQRISVFRHYPFQEYSP